ncbi:hypothetical protein QQ965_03630 [Candidatus Saccharibacteria bacterium oral taxon 955]
MAHNRGSFAINLDSFTAHIVVISQRRASRIAPVAHHLSQTSFSVER